MGGICGENATKLQSGRGEWLLAKQANQEEHQESDGKDQESESQLGPPVGK